MKTISIVTPSFNSIKYIENCVESVRYVLKGLPYEHIIADGGSTDGTLEYLKKQPDLRLLYGPDQGMYDALNKGIDMAKGEVIGHLNTDEQYNREAFLDALTRFDDTYIDAVFGSTIMLDENLKFLYLFNQVVIPKVIDTQWHMPVQTVSLLYRKAVWARAPFDINYRVVADHVWFRRQMELGLTLASVRNPMGIFLWHGKNLSMDRACKENALADVKRDSLRLSIAKRWYRLKKLLAGGYHSKAFSYELWQDGQIRSVRIKKPSLRAKNPKSRATA